MSRREEADMSDEPSRLILAEPDTVLGMLQRGRGAGYLHAVEMAPQRVWPLLIECITNDPRLDKQVQDIADYYSELVIETEMDITPLADHLKRNDGPGDQHWNVKLVLETLYCLSEDHHDKALEILRDYVSYGFHWETVIRYLWDFRLASALEAFWRLDGIGHIPEIESAFIAVPHSYHRWRAAWAMDTTAPDVFQANYAYECLWDCHEDTRICGCETVSLSQPGALARLKEIAEDPGENKRVRDSAVQTLDEF